MPSGTVVTRFNFNRPKWFGGFFGFTRRHNQPGNCLYDAEAMGRVISPEDLNRLAGPMYLLTPVLCYHMAITIYLALSVLLGIMQLGFNWLIEFAFLDIAPSNGYLHTLGILWYCVWIAGLVVVVPLYYVSLVNVHRYFGEGTDPIFRELRVKVRLVMGEPSKFVLIPGFKKVEGLEIISGSDI